MRCLNRNKQDFRYALYESKTEVVDEWGNPTGTFSVTYSSPVLMSANISAARGTADAEIFGINTAYTKTVVTDNMNCPIDENSIIWLGIEPDGNGEAGTVKHNYAVTQIAKGLNSITYAIREVTVG